MYYFHLRDDESVPDIDGTDLSNASEARTHAIGVARELMFKSRGMLDHDWAYWTMSVRDSGVMSCSLLGFLTWRLMTRPTSHPT
jgi:hypothetical protein